MLKLSLLPSLVLLSAPALAAEAAPPDDAIIVTATRTPTPIDRVASSVTVLDKPAIDRSQAIVVSDLIIRTPGVTFSRNGGFGGVTGISIRGANSDQTVVVIDGVKINDPSSPGGGYDFAHLLAGDIDRVEVLRGPQSTLWGSQAIGGVVNVVTASPTKPLEGSFDAEGGSRDTASGRAAIGGTSERIDWRVAGNAFTTKGISAISPRFGGSEKDGYRNFGGSGRLDVRIAEGVAADLRGYYSRGRTEFDSSFSVPPDTHEYGTSAELIGYAGLKVDLLDGRFRNRVAVTYSDINRDYYDPDAPAGSRKTFDSDGHNRRFEYQGNLTIADRWNAVFGAETEKSTFRALSPQFATVPDRGDAQLDSFYGQLNAEPIAGLSLTAGLRHDHHDRFGGKTLASAGAAWSLGGGNTVLRASYGEGFKAPTLYQLFSEFGNEALRPEQAHGWDAGIEQRLLDRKVALSLTYFERDTKNLIVFVDSPPRDDRPFGYYDSVARARAHGIEGGATAEFRTLTLSGNATWTDTEDRSAGPDFGNELARRPRYTANADASYAWGFGLTTGVAVRYAGRSFDNAASAFGGQNRLDDYTLVDLRAEYPVAERFTLFARVENLFDEEYETARKYGSIGRSFYGGVRGRF